MSGFDPAAHRAEQRRGERVMAAPVTCQRCGMPDPSPDQTCKDGHDHFVGTGRGCGNCGRLTEACVKRPCSARRAGKASGDD